MPNLANSLQRALGAGYRIERELPLSGLGRMFLALEAETGRRVTVQALPPDIARQFDVVRFRAAVDQVRGLRHAGIMPLLAAGAQDDLVWCVWPHPSGESLRYRLIRDGGLGSDESVQVLYDVADALAYGHAQGVTHGDIRPDNIYLEGGRAVIAEFGIRSALGAALGMGEGAADARADVHALAVTGQQLLGGRGGPAAAVIARELSINPAEQYPGAGAFRDALGSPPSARRRRVRLRVAAIVVLFAALAGILFHQSQRQGALDDNLVAVAPFDILDPAHLVWREGLMTVLAGNLDGAGPLRAVSPTVVVRRWREPADFQAAARLGRQTGARVALFGRVERTGGDTVRITATLVDAQELVTLAEVQLSDPASRMDRLADSLTVRVLRELGRSRPITAARSGSLGTGSLPALREFLEGEQHYRRSEWDAALVNYQRAIELDTNFALAFYRAGIVLGWLSTSSDSLSQAYLTHAASHNRGLPPRDSMLVVAESLSTAVDEGADNPRYWEHYRRIYATTAEAVRRYPNDPEVWYEYADVRYHNPAFSSLREMREAFDRTIAIDPEYAPAYIHQIELALQLGDPSGAQGYIQRYLDLDPRDVYADAIRLTRRLLDPADARSDAVRAILDTASADQLLATIQSFRGWPDTLETSIRLAQQLVARDTSIFTAHGRVSSFLPELGSALGYHGHVREAYRRGGQIGWIFVAAAWMGGVPEDTVRAVLGWSLRTQPLWPRAMGVIGAPVFAQRRDSVQLLLLERRADSLARSDANPQHRAYARYAADGARALLALVRGDTAAAIRGLTALPDTACQRCVLYRTLLAQLLDAGKLDAEAARLLAQDSPGFVHPADGFWELYRARLATRRGDRVAAARAYKSVRDAWLHGDAVLQPYVTEAREALAGLRSTR